MLNKRRTQPILAGQAVRRAIACALVAAFVIQDSSYALIDLAASSRVESKTLSVPGDLGVIRETFDGTSPQTVINIKDIHDNYLAQESIARLLENLVTRYQIRTIGIEGHQGFVDPSLLASLPDPAMRRKTAEYMIRKGTLSAGEFFAAMNGTKVAVYGMDDEKLYQENLESFKRNLETEKANAHRLDRLTDALDRLKAQIYSKDLADLDRNGIMDERSELKFSDRWGTISGMADRFGIGYAQYPNISRLLESKRAEVSVDFAGAGEERRRLVEKLGRTLTGSKLEDFVAQSVAYKLGQRSQAAFSTYLIEQAAAAGIPETSSARLKAYADYMTFFESIDVDAIKDEIRALEDVIREKLFRNGDERRLFALARQTEVLRDMFEMKLSSVSLAFFREHRSEFRQEAFEEFLKRHGVDTAPIDVAGIFASIPETVRFYDAAEARNHALMNNTVERMRRNGETVACLVTGGFHSRGIADLLKDDKVSYVVILPRFVTSAKRPYVTILTSQKGSYREFLRSEEVTRTKITMTAHYFAQLAFAVAKKNEQKSDAQKNKLIAEAVEAAKAEYLRTFQTMRDQFRRDGLIADEGSGARLPSASPALQTEGARPLPSSYKMLAKRPDDYLAQMLQVNGDQNVSGLQVVLSGALVLVTFDIDGKRYTKVAAQRDGQTVVEDSILEGEAAVSAFESARTEAGAQTVEVVSGALTVDGLDQKIGQLLNFSKTATVEQILSRMRQLGLDAREVADASIADLGDSSHLASDVLNDADQEADEAHVGIASTGGSLKSKAHVALHDKGQFQTVIWAIAEEIGAPLVYGKTDEWDLKSKVRENGGTLNTSHGQLRLETRELVYSENGQAHAYGSSEILVIVDDRFGADHAGLGRMTAYARTEAKARHEISELSAFAAAAIWAVGDSALLNAEDIRAGRFGQKINAYLRGSDLPATLSTEERSALIVARSSKIKSVFVECHIVGERAEQAFAKTQTSDGSFDPVISSEGTAALDASTSRIGKAAQNRNLELARKLKQSKDAIITRINDLQTWFRSRSSWTADEAVQFRKELDRAVAELGEVQAQYDTVTEAEASDPILKFAERKEQLENGQRLLSDLQLLCDLIARNLSGTETLLGKDLPPHAFIRVEGAVQAWLEAVRHLRAKPEVGATGEIELVGSGTFSLAFRSGNYVYKYEYNPRAQEDDSFTRANKGDRRNEQTLTETLNRTAENFGDGQIAAITTVETVGQNKQMVVQQAGTPLDAALRQARESGDSKRAGELLKMWFDLQRKLMFRYGYLVADSNAGNFLLVQDRNGKEILVANDFHQMLRLQNGTRIGYDADGTEQPVKIIMSTEEKTDIAAYFLYYFLLTFFYAGQMAKAQPEMQEQFLAFRQEFLNDLLEESPSASERQNQKRFLRGLEELFEQAEDGTTRIERIFLQGQQTAKSRRAINRTTINLIRESLDEGTLTQFFDRIAERKLQTAAQSQTNIAQQIAARAEREITEDRAAALIDEVFTEAEEAQLQAERAAAEAAAEAEAKAQAQATAKAEARAKAEATAAAAAQAKAVAEAVAAAQKRREEQKQKAEAAEAQQRIEAEAVAARTRDLDAMEQEFNALNTDPSLQLEERVERLRALTARLEALRATPATTTDLKSYWRQRVRAFGLLMRLLQAQASAYAEAEQRVPKALAVQFNDAKGLTEEEAGLWAAARTEFQNTLSRAADAASARERKAAEAEARQADADRIRQEMQDSAAKLQEQMDRAQADLQNADLAELEIAALQELRSVQEKSQAIQALGVESTTADTEALARAQAAVKSTRSWRSDQMKRKLAAIEREQDPTLRAEQVRTFLKETVAAQKLHAQKTGEGASLVRAQFFAQVASALVNSRLIDTSEEAIQGLEELNETCSTCTVTLTQAAAQGKISGDYTTFASDFAVSMTQSADRIARRRQAELDRQAELERQAAEEQAADKTAAATGTDTSAETETSTDTQISAETEIQTESAPTDQVSTETQAAEEQAADETAVATATDAAAETETSVDTEILTKAQAVEVEDAATDADSTQTNQADSQPTAPTTPADATAPAAATAPAQKRPLNRNPKNIGERIENVKIAIENKMYGHARFELYLILTEYTRDGKFDAAALKRAGLTDEMIDWMADMHKDFQISKIHEEMEAGNAALAAGDVEKAAQHFRVAAALSTHSQVRNQFYDTVARMAIAAAKNGKIEALMDAFSKQESDQPIFDLLKVIVEFESQDERIPPFARFNKALQIQLNDKEITAKFDTEKSATQKLIQRVELEAWDAMLRSKNLTAGKDDKEINVLRAKREMIRDRARKSIVEIHEHDKDYQQGTASNQVTSTEDLVTRTFLHVMMADRLRKRASEKTLDREQNRLESSCERNNVRILWNGTTYVEMDEYERARDRVRPAGLSDEEAHVEREDAWRDVDAAARIEFLTQLASQRDALEKLKAESQEAYDKHVAELKSEYGFNVESNRFEKEIAEIEKAWQEANSSPTRTKPVDRRTAIIEKLRNENQLNSSIIEAAELKQQKQSNLLAETIKREAEDPERDKSQNALFRFFGEATGRNDELLDAWEALAEARVSVLKKREEFNLFYQKLMRDRESVLRQKGQDMIDPNLSDEEFRLRSENLLAEFQGTLAVEDLKELEQKKAAFEAATAEVDRTQTAFKTKNAQYYTNNSDGQKPTQSTLIDSSQANQRNSVRSRVRSGFAAFKILLSEALQQGPQEGRPADLQLQALQKALEQAQENVKRDPVHNRDLELLLNLFKVLRLDAEELTAFFTEGWRQLPENLSPMQIFDQLGDLLANVLETSIAGYNEYFYHVYLTGGEDSYFAQEGQWSFMLNVAFHSTRAMRGARRSRAHVLLLQAGAGKETAFAAGMTAAQMAHARMPMIDNRMKSTFEVSENDPIRIVNGVIQINNLELFQNRLVKSFVMAGAEASNLVDAAVKNESLYLAAKKGIPVYTLRGKDLIRVSYKLQDEMKDGQPVIKDGRRIQVVVASEETILANIEDGKTPDGTKISRDTLQNLTGIMYFMGKDLQGVVASAYTPSSANEESKSLARGVLGSLRASAMDEVHALINANPLILGASKDAFLDVRKTDVKSYTLMLRQQWISWRLYDQLMPRVIELKQGAGAKARGGVQNVNRGRFTVVTRENVQDLVRGLYQDTEWRTSFEKAFPTRATTDEAMMSVIESAVTAMLKSDRELEFNDDGSYTVRSQDSGAPQKDTILGSRFDAMFTTIRAAYEVEERLYGTPRDQVLDSPRLADYFDKVGDAMVHETSFSVTSARLIDEMGGANAVMGTATIVDNPRTLTGVGIGAVDQLTKEDRPDRDLQVFVETRSERYEARVRQLLQMNLLLDIGSPSVQSNEFTSTMTPRGFLKELEALGIVEMGAVDRMTEAEMLNRINTVLTDKTLYKRLRIFAVNKKIELPKDLTSRLEALGKASEPNLYELQKINRWLLEIMFAGKFPTQGSLGFMLVTDKSLGLLTARYQRMKREVHFLAIRNGLRFLQAQNPEMDVDQLLRDRFNDIDPETFTAEGMLETLGIQLSAKDFAGLKKAMADSLIAALFGRTQEQEEKGSFIYRFDAATGRFTETQSKWQTADNAMKEFFKARVKDPTAAKTVIFGQGVNEGWNGFGNPNGKAGVIITELLPFNKLAQASRRVDTAQRAKGPVFQVLNLEDISQLRDEERQKIAAAQNDPEFQREIVFQVQRDMLEESDASTHHQVVQDRARLNGTSRTEFDALIRKLQPGGPMHQLSEQAASQAPSRVGALVEFLIPPQPPQISSVDGRATTIVWTDEDEWRRRQLKEIEIRAFLEREGLLVPGTDILNVEGQHLASIAARLVDITDENVLVTLARFLNNNVTRTVLNDGTEQIRINDTVLSQEEADAFRSIQDTPAILRDGLSPTDALFLARLMDRVGLVKLNNPVYRGIQTFEDVLAPILEMIQAAGVQVQPDEIVLILSQRSADYMSREDEDDQPGLAMERLAFVLKRYFGVDISQMERLQLAKELKPLRDELQRVDKELKEFQDDADKKLASPDAFTTLLARRQELMTQIAQFQMNLIGALDGIDRRLRIGLRREAETEDGAPPLTPTPQAVADIRFNLLVVAGVVPKALRANPAVWNRTTMAPLLTATQPDGTPHDLGRIAEVWNREAPEAIQEAFGQGSLSHADGKPMTARQFRQQVVQKGLLPFALAELGAAFDKPEEKIDAVIAFLKERHVIDDKDDKEEKELRAKIQSLLEKNSELAPALRESLTSTQLSKLEDATILLERLTPEAVIRVALQGDLVSGFHVKNKQDQKALQKATDKVLRFWKEERGRDLAELKDGTVVEALSSFPGGYTQRWAAQTILGGADELDFQSRSADVARSLDQEAARHSQLTPAALAETVKRFPSSGRTPAPDAPPADWKNLWSDEDWEAFRILSGFERLQVEQSIDTASRLAPVAGPGYALRLSITDLIGLRRVAERARGLMSRNGKVYDREVRTLMAEEGLSGKLNYAAVYFLAGIRSVDDLIPYKELPVEFKRPAVSRNNELVERKDPTGVLLTLAAEEDEEIQTRGVAETKQFKDFEDKTTRLRMNLQQLARFEHFADRLDAAHRMAAGAHHRIAADMTLAELAGYATGKPEDTETLFKRIHRSPYMQPGDPLLLQAVQGLRQLARQRIAAAKNKKPGDPDDLSNFPILAEDLMGAAVGYFESTYGKMTRESWDRKNDELFRRRTQALFQVFRMYRTDINDDDWGHFAGQIAHVRIMEEMHSRMIEARGSDGKPAAFSRSKSRIFNLEQMLVQAGQKSAVVLEEKDGQGLQVGDSFYDANHRILKYLRETMRRPVSPEAVAALEALSEEERGQLTETELFRILGISLEGVTAQELVVVRREMERGVMMHVTGRNPDGSLRAVTTGISDYNSATLKEIEALKAGDPDGEGQLDEITVDASAGRKFRRIKLVPGAKGLAYERYSQRQTENLFGHENRKESGFIDFVEAAAKFTKHQAQLNELAAELHDGSLRFTGEVEELDDTVIRIIAGALDGHLAGDRITDAQRRQAQNVRNALQRLLNARTEYQTKLAQVKKLYRDIKVPEEDRFEGRTFAPWVFGASRLELDSSFIVTVCQMLRHAYEAAEERNEAIGDTFHKYRLTLIDIYKDTSPNRSDFANAKNVRAVTSSVRGLRDALEVADGYRVLPKSIEQTIDEEFWDIVQDPRPTFEEFVRRAYPKESEGLDEAGLRKLFDAATVAKIEKHLQEGAGSEYEATIAYSDSFIEKMVAMRVAEGPGDDHDWVRAALTAWQHESGHQQFVGNGISDAAFRSNFREDRRVIIGTMSILPLGLKEPLPTRALDIESKRRQLKDGILGSHDIALDFFWFLKMRSAVAPRTTPGINNEILQGWLEKLQNGSASERRTVQRQIADMVDKMFDSALRGHLQGGAESDAHHRLAGLIVTVWRAPRRGEKDYSTRITEEVYEPLANINLTGNSREETIMNVAANHYLRMVAGDPTAYLLTDSMIAQSAQEALEKMPEYKILPRSDIDRVVHEVVAIHRRGHGRANAAETLYGNVPFATRRFAEAELFLLRQARMLSAIPPDDPELLWKSDEAFIEFERHFGGLRRDGAIPRRLQRLGRQFVAQWGQFAAPASLTRAGSAMAGLACPQILMTGMYLALGQIVTETMIDDDSSDSKISGELANDLEGSLAALNRGDWIGFGNRTEDIRLRARGFVGDRIRNVIQRQPAVDRAFKRGGEKPGSTGTIVQELQQILHPTSPYITGSKPEDRERQAVILGYMRERAERHIREKNLKPEESAALREFLLKEELKLAQELLHHSQFPTKRRAMQRIDQIMAEWIALLPDSDQSKEAAAAAAFKAELSQVASAYTQKDAGLITPTLSRVLTHWTAQNYQEQKLGEQASSIPLLEQMRMDLGDSASKDEEAVLVGLEKDLRSKFAVDGPDGSGKKSFRTRQREWAAEALEDHRMTDPAVGRIRGLAETLRASNIPPHREEARDLELALAAAAAASGDWEGAQAGVADLLASAESEEESPSSDGSRLAPIDDPVAHVLETGLRANGDILAARRFALELSGADPQRFRSARLELAKKGMLDAAEEIALMNELADALGEPENLAEAGLSARGPVLESASDLAALVAFSRHSNQPPTRKALGRLVRQLITADPRNGSKFLRDALIEISKEKNNKSRRVRVLEDFKAYLGTAETWQPSDEAMEGALQIALQENAAQIQSEKTEASSPERLLKLEDRRKELIEQTEDHSEAMEKRSKTLDDAIEETTGVVDALLVEIGIEEANAVSAIDQILTWTEVDPRRRNRGIQMIAEVLHKKSPDPEADKQSAAEIVDMLLLIRSAEIDDNPNFEPMVSQFVSMGMPPEQARAYASQALGIDAAKKSKENWDQGILRLAAEAAIASEDADRVQRVWQRAVANPSQPAIQVFADAYGKIQKHRLLMGKQIQRLKNISAKDADWTWDIRIQSAGLTVKLDADRDLGEIAARPGNIALYAIDDKSPEYPNLMKLADKAGKAPAAGERMYLMVKIGDAASAVRGIMIAKPENVAAGNLQDERHFFTDQLLERKDAGKVPWTPEEIGKQEDILAEDMGFPANRIDNLGAVGQARFDAGQLNEVALSTVIRLAQERHAKGRRVTGRWINFAYRRHVLTEADRMGIDRSRIQFPAKGYFISKDGTNPAGANVSGSSGITHGNRWEDTLSADELLKIDAVVALEVTDETGEKLFVSSDETRMFCLGTPTPEQRRLMRKSLELNEASFRNMEAKGRFVSDSEGLRETYDKQKIKDISDGYTNHHIDAASSAAGSIHGELDAQRLEDKREALGLRGIDMDQYQAVTSEPFFVAGVGAAGARRAYRTLFYEGDPNGSFDQIREVETKELQRLADIAGMTLEDYVRERIAKDTLKFLRAPIAIDAETGTELTAATYEETRMRRQIGLNAEQQPQYAYVPTARRPHVLSRAMQERLAARRQARLIQDSSSVYAGKVALAIAVRFDNDVDEETGRQVIAKLEHAYGSADRSDSAESSVFRVPTNLSDEGVNSALQIKTGNYPVRMELDLRRIGAPGSDAQARDEFVEKALAAAKNKIESSGAEIILETAGVLQQVGQDRSKGAELLAKWVSEKPAQPAEIGDKTQVYDIQVPQLIEQFFGPASNDTTDEAKAAQAAADAKASQTASEFSVAALVRATAGASAPRESGENAVVAIHSSNLFDAKGAIDRNAVEYVTGLSRIGREVVILQPTSAKALSAELQQQLERAGCILFQTKNSPIRMLQEMRTDSRWSDQEKKISMVIPAHYVAYRGFGDEVRNLNNSEKFRFVVVPIADKSEVAAASVASPAARVLSIMTAALTQTPFTALGDETEEFFTPTILDELKKMKARFIRFPRIADILKAATQSARMAGLSA